MTHKTKVQYNCIYVTFRQGEGLVAYRPRGSILPPPTPGGETWLKAGRDVAEIPLQAVTEQQVLSRFREA